MFLANLVYLCRLATPEPKLSEWTVHMDEKIGKLLQTLTSAPEGRRAAKVEVALQAQREEEEKVSDRFGTSNARRAAAD